MYSVIVCDLFHSHDPDHEIEITGFPTPELAIEYARRRVRDSVEEMRQENQSSDSLRDQWRTFGEDCYVVSPGGLLYRAFAEIETFLTQPASDQERDWMGLYRRLTGP